jgi:putative ABC transport system ATP-binding protein
VLLKVRSVCKRYTTRGASVDALQDVDLDVEEGRFLTVTGPSGSGKSTLLLALGGLLGVTSGEVYFRDQPLHLLRQGELAAYRSGHVGFVMQNFSLVPYLSAERNVMIPLALGGADKTTQRQRAREQLARVGLAERGRHLPRELSVGQQQRVAIARALANDPELILADEPTGNLDPDLATHTLDLLKRLNEEQGLTIVMVTHSPEAAARGNQRVHLVDGRIEAVQARAFQASLS